MTRDPSLPAGKTQEPRRLLVPLLVASNVVLMIAVIVLATRPGPVRTTDTPPAPSIPRRGPDVTAPRQQAARDATVQPARPAPVSLAGVLAEKNSLAGKEFIKKLQDACSSYEHASPDEIREAFRQLPPGSDYLGAFNSLSFYLFKNSKGSEMGFYRTLLKEKVFPREWISNAVNNGMSQVGASEPARAIADTVANGDLFTSDTGTARGLNEILRRHMAEGGGDLSASIATITTLPAPLATKVANHLYFWTAVVATGDIKDTLGRFQAASTVLPEPALAYLGFAISEAGGFDQGLEMIRDQAANSTPVINGFIDQWMQRDPNMVLPAMDRIDPALHDGIITRNLRKIATWDAAAAQKWANQIKDPAAKAKALEEIGK